MELIQIPEPPEHDCKLYMKGYCRGCEKWVQLMLAFLKDNN